MTCPKCYGEGIDVVRAYPGGASPDDYETDCPLCYGTGDASNRQARRYLSRLAPDVRELKLSRLAGAA